MNINGIGHGKLTLEIVRKLQKHDVFYNAMFRYLQYGHMPEEKVLARRIRTNKDVYIIDNRLLYHIWNKRSDKNIICTNNCVFQMNCDSEFSVYFMIQTLLDIEVRLKCKKMR